MPADRPNIQSMAAELRERLLYMRELGVEETAASLAAVPDIPNKDRIPNKSVPKSSEKEERVPPPELADLMSKAGSEPDDRTSTSQAGRERRNLLGATKLSDMANKREKTPTITRAADEQKAEKPVDADSSAEPPVIVKRKDTADESVNDIHADIGPDCSRCELCEKRTQVVNSVGNYSADLMIVGEAPGADEDQKGEPFVGRAGKLLTKILEAIDFPRDAVFIGNINRCRPPGNRQPTLEESAMCKPFLLREIEAVKPKVIVVLGNTATKNLLETTTGITKLRGTFVEKFGVKVMPTFHPAYLLRDPRKKREVWADMQKVRDFLKTSAE